MLTWKSKIREADPCPFRVHQAHMLRNLTLERQRQPRRYQGMARAETLRLTGLLQNHLVPDIHRYRTIATAQTHISSDGNRIPQLHYMPWSRYTRLPRLPTAEIRLAATRRISRITLTTVDQSLRRHLRSSPISRGRGRDNSPRVIWSFLIDIVRRRSPKRAN